MDNSLSLSVPSDIPFDPFPKGAAALPIFVGGTRSHVGKSWVVTAICRYLYRMGYRVAPFKAQNMSNNSMVCPQGGEIGRAQAVQAQACGLAPHPDMNPILLKPTGVLGSQVVLHGSPWRNLRPVDYYAQFDFLMEEALSSYRRLAAHYDYIVIEGAGSIAELNLKHCDLVNLNFARRVNAPGILVADIDLGGVFASVIGTFHLLDAAEFSLVRSFLVNRFRGDSTLFEAGVRILESKAGRPCLGVFPYAPDVQLDPEDSVSLDEPGTRGCVATHHLRDTSRAAIIRLPHISNFTDFRLLPDAIYLSRPVNERFDVIFLPGTKSTIEDMLWLRSSGLETWLLDQARRGARVVGVCGGFQMLGEEIADPHGVESPIPAVQGLGLLPVRTHITQRKITRLVQARTPSGIRFEAYEIHMGITLAGDHATPFALLEDGTRDGIRTAMASGTYLHGALENKGVLEDLLGYSIEDSPAHDKGAQYDRLADWFAQHVDQRLFAQEYLRVDDSRACFGQDLRNSSEQSESR